MGLYDLKQTDALFHFTLSSKRAPTKSSQSVEMEERYLDVCAGANSYAALGEFFLKYESPLNLPNDVLPFVDLDALGYQYESLHPGIFIGSDYVIYPAL